MDIRKYYFQNYFLAIFFIIIHQGFCALEDDYEEGPAFGKCPWIRNKLRNGRVRIRYKGRIAKFLCDSGYELAGKRSSTCVRGQWSNPIPVCVARGCNRVPSIANGRVTEMYRGALLVYDCNPGYTLTGDISIHCDGRKWNASPPACEVNPDLQPETSCDFESPYLCGWSHDPTHDFDWKRNQFDTPSGHVGTGPSHDHTFGENKGGYYLYIEASSPRKRNDTARLFSPVYPAQESGGCFTFWYHMYGATTGGLRVYFKPESHVFGELSPKWEKFGDQGNQWLRGNISVPTVNENFQIVIEGIRGESYVGDSAIDDVQLTHYNCQAIENSNETTAESTSANSCRGRCRTSSQIEGSCECKESCIAADNCCTDYHILCFDGNESVESNTNKPEPGDYYGKTASPLTLPATLSSSTTTGAEVLTSTTHTVLNITSESSTALLSSSAVPEATSTVIQTSSTLHSPSTISSLASTTNEMTTLSTSSISSTELITVRNKNTSTSTSFSITTPSTETTSRKSSTESSGETTPSKLSTLMSTTTVKTSSKPKVTKSTRSTTKLLKNTPKISSTTTSKPTQSTTKPSTTQKTTTTTPLTSIQITTTATPTTSIQTTTTTTPMTSTQKTTTTTPMTSSQKTTTTTPMTSTQEATTATPMTSTQKTTTTTTMATTTSSTSERYRTTTPLTTTVKQSSTTPTTLGTTQSQPTHVPIIGPTLTSSTVLIPTVSSTLSPSSTIPDTTTPRYNLRPRNRTSFSPSTTLNPTTTYSSSKQSPFTLGSTTSTSKAELSTLSSTISRRTTQTRRWFTFTPSTTTSIPTTTIRWRAPIYIHSSRFFPSTTTLPSDKLSTTVRHKWVYSRDPSVYSSSPTTSDSFEMVASKTEHSKGNGNSSVIIGVVIFIVICIVGGVAFYIRRNKQKRLSKLDDDSELRFLPDSDYMDYSDASALDRILIK